MYINIYIHITISKYIQVCTGHAGWRWATLEGAMPARLENQSNGHEIPDDTAGVTAEALRLALHDGPH